MSKEEPITEEMFKKYIEYLSTLTGAELISQLKIRTEGEKSCSEEEFKEKKEEEEDCERIRKRTHRTFKEA